MLPRYEFYELGKELTVEIYIKEQATKIEVVNANELVVCVSHNQYVYDLAHDVQLLSFTQNKYKLEVQLLSMEYFKVLLKATKVLDKTEKYDQMEEDGYRDGQTSDMMDKVREIYDNADDRTREAMFNSYYQSQGTVLSTKWDSAYEEDKQQND